MPRTAFSFLVLIAAIAGTVQAATLRLPELATLSRTSSAAIAAPGTLTCSFTVTAGTSQTQSVQLLFRTPSGATRTLVGDVSTGIASVAVGTDWQNGAYTLTTITTSDVWGRALSYNADGSVTVPEMYANAYVAQIATLPNRHSLNFAALGFTVTGGIATPTAPRVTQLTLSQPGPFAPGSAVSCAYAFTPGSSPVTRIEARFQYGTLTRSVIVSSPAATGTIDIPITADMLNGPVTLQQFRLTDAQARSTTYSRGSSNISDLNYSADLQSSPSPLNLGSLGFTITGANAQFTPPSLALSSNAASAVNPGATVRFTFTVTPNNFPTTGLLLVLIGPLKMIRGFTADGISGTVDVPIGADWINGSYSIMAYAVAPGNVNYGLPMPSGAGNSFTVSGGFASNPIITQQPEPTQTVVEGQYASVSIEAVGAGTLSYQWYRGSRGDISNPITTGTSTFLALYPTDTATYWVRVTSGGVATDSAEAVIAVNKKPVITQQPTNQSAAVDGSATFSVSATSLAPLSYHWKVGLREFTASEYNQPTVTFSNLTAADAGQVWCVVSNSAGETISEKAILNIRVSSAPLTITMQPQDAVTMPGNGPTVSFDAAATGNPPLLYQWQKDGVDLPSQKSATLHIGTYGIPADAAGTYRLKVTNGVETVYSRGATLSFANAPVILGLLGSGAQNALVGNYVSFYPGVLGQAPFTYQWRKNGQPIAGATSSRLDLGPLTLADAGSYDVVVSNSAGSATSLPAVVTVSEAVVAPEITRNPLSLTVAAGQSAAFSVEATGSDLRYQWRKNGWIIPGATNATYTIPAASSSDAGKYDVSVTNTAGDRGSQVATLTVTTSLAAPTITRQPVGQVLRAGDALILTASADGAAPLQVQWLFNGAPLSSSTTVLGTTTDTLRVYNFAAANAGAYALRATNSSGTATSNVATISLLAATDKARIVNVSVRAGVSPEAGPLIVGFVVGGANTTGTIPLLVRGVGPALQNYDVTDALANPQLWLYFDGAVNDGNDDWLGSSQVTTVGASVGAFPFASWLSRDAAFVKSFWTGAFTTHVVEAHNGSGTALAEVYDATTTDAKTDLTPRLTNVSARTLVRPGQPLIAGFVIRGAGQRTILIRGIGPSLTRFDVADVLATPTLTLYDGKSVKMTENTGWTGAAALSTAFTQVGAFPLATDSKDSALIVSLPAGNYTAQVSGAAATTGAALIEVYEVP